MTIQIHLKFNAPSFPKTLWDLVSPQGKPRPARTRTWLLCKNVLQRPLVCEELEVLPNSIPSHLGRS